MFSLLWRLLPDVLRHSHSGDIDIRRGEFRDDSLRRRIWNICHHLCNVQQVGYCCCCCCYCWLQNVTCQPGLPWTAVLEESIPHPLALILPDGAGHSDHLLHPSPLLPQLPPRVATHLSILCHIHHLLLLESYEETISGNGFPQTRPGTHYTSLHHFLDVPKPLLGYSRYRDCCARFPAAVLVRNRK